MQTSPPDEGLHRCPHCGRAYDRPDHLARHLESHKNQRTFKCPICQRGFNRRDVLQRHQAIHSGGSPLRRRPKERATKACEECAASKLSCDNSRPCKRCQRKNIPCVPREPRAIRKPSLPAPSPDESTASSSLFTPPVPSASSGASFQGHAYPHDSSFQMDRLNEFPAFFEQVMLADHNTPDESQAIAQPCDLFDLMNTEFTPSETGPYSSLIPNLDGILGLEAFSVNEFQQPPSTENQQFTEKRAAAFRRSLWLWNPEKNQNAFSDSGCAIDDVSSSLSTSYQAPLSALKIPDKLTSQARDDIFQLVIKTAGSQVVVDSFPSAESLDTLIKIGFAKRAESDAWIHPYTLYHGSVRPELWTALVAAGCVCCSIPTVNKTGVVLQEIARVSLANLAELDNSVLRDLQYFQASMVWLDIGIYCGYNRKMQIAESYLQPLCTALRRTGMFDRSSYTALTPEFDSGGHSIESLWREWVRQESFKRLVYHLYQHDIEAAAAMNRPQLISYTELTLPLPAPRDLWLATNATEWRDMWFSQCSRAQPSGLSLRQLLTDPSATSYLPSEVDASVARSVLIHGLLSQVREFRQQALLLEDSHTRSRATARLWLQSRQDDLYSILVTLQSDMPNIPAVLTLLTEFTMMSLYTSMDSIQRFVGQMGEQEAKQEYPRLREWSYTQEARLSIWHAGQVFRSARQVPPYQLRGFDCTVIYHAALVLWTFGLLRCGERQRAGVTERLLGDEHIVPVDGPEHESAKAFIHQNVGEPGLQLHIDHQGPRYCPLHSPRQVMEVTGQVFESNYPGSTNNLPPIVKNIRNLIRDLANLP